MAIRNTYAAESWDKVYDAFEQINFTSYDYDTIKASLIQYLKTYYPEKFNDFIESSELIAVLELFAYIAELLAYRVDMMSHENFITTAQRKQSILKLAKLISYKPSRNIPARGLAKISSVKTTEEVYDSLGNNLADTAIFWNDSNNSNWKEQFFLVFNKILTSKFGQPSKSFQISDVLMQLYTLNNDVNSFRNGVFSFSTDNITERLLLEAVPADVDENGPMERAPDSNGQFSLIYSVDGRGDGSDFTGFLLLLKQGNLLRTDYEITEQTSNRRIELDAEGVNNTDVWVYRVDESGSVIEKWEQIETLNEQNLYFNGVSATRKKFEVETLENDRIALHFGDGDLSDSPIGLFQLWCRTSANRNITIPKNAVTNQLLQFLYVNQQNNTHQATITFSLTAAMQNNAMSETTEHIRQSAPSTYYAQNRMVNAQDYNTYMLKDSTILRLKAINRTFAGQPKHLEWNDASKKYENVKLFGDDLKMFMDNGVEYTESSLGAGAVIDGVIEKRLSSKNFLTALTHVYANTELCRGIVTHPRRRFINDVELGVTEVDDIVAAMNGSGQSSALQYFGLKFNPVRQMYSNGTIALYDKYDPKDLASQNWRRNNSIDPMGLDTYDLSCPADGLDFYDDRVETLTLEMTADKITFSVISSVRGNLPNYTLDGRRWSEQVSTPIPLDFKISEGSVPFAEGDAFVVDIKKYTESQNTSYGPRWGASVRQGMSSSANRGFNATGKWEILTPEQLSNEDYNLQNGPNSIASVIEFNPEDEVSSWMFILKNAGSLNEPTWLIWSRDLKIIAESKNTKFWYNQNEQILDFETKKPVTDKIRVLKSNLDHLGKPLLRAHVYDVVGSVVNEDGSVNFNRVQLLPSTSNEINIGQHVINPSITQFENFSVGSYEYFIINEQTGVIERYLDDCDSYQISGYDVGMYDVTSYDSGGVVVNSGIGAGTYDFLTNKFISDQLDNPDVAQNSQYRLGRKKKVPALISPHSTECDINAGLDFMWQHFTPMHNMIDPSTTNINDMFILTNGYYTAMQSYVNGDLPQEPAPPTSVELRTSYGALLKAKMISDTVVLHSGKIKLLFGEKAQQKLRAKFRVVKSPQSSFSDERIKQEVLNVVNTYFDIKNWDFGQKFYATELLGLIHQRLSTHILSVVLVPMDPNSNFGSLFTIDSGFDEVLQSGATISDVEMIGDITPQAIRQR